MGNRLDVSVIGWMTSGISHVVFGSRIGLRRAVALRSGRNETAKSRISAATPRNLGMFSLLNTASGGANAYARLMQCAAQSGATGAYCFQHLSNLGMLAG